MASTPRYRSLVMVMHHLGPPYGMLEIRVKRKYGITTETFEMCGAYKMALL